MSWLEGSVRSMDEIKEVKLAITKARVFLVQAIWVRFVTTFLNKHEFFNCCNLKAVCSVQKQKFPIADNMLMIIFMFALSERLFNMKDLHPNLH